MSSNIHLKNEAISLRKKGESYNNIRKILGIKSKGTISYWLKGLKLPKESAKLLKRNNELAHEKGLFKANENRSLRIKEENSNAFKNGYSLINSISKYEILLIGTSLYWAEGMKSERTVPTLTFSNSDPLMVGVYMRFLREILEINEKKIRAGIHIYSSISDIDAKKFWSSVTKLPEDRFYIVTQVSKASKNKRPLNILPFGTVAIKVNSRVQFHKVKGMIKGIIDKLAK